MAPATAGEPPLTAHGCAADAWRALTDAADAAARGDLDQARVLLGVGGQMQAFAVALSTNALLQPPREERR